MILSRDLAKAIYEISINSSSNDEEIISAILEYVKTYHLESLLPKTITYLEEFTKKEKQWNTFFLDSRYELDNEIIEKIQNKLNTKKSNNIITRQNSEIIGGFIATYQGMIYDASIKNQLQLLKKSLMK